MKSAAAILVVLLSACASTPSEQDPMQVKLNDLDARTARMERALANQVEVSQRLDEVQANLRELRGRIEELEHSNEALTKQQRDLSDRSRQLFSQQDGYQSGLADKRKLADDRQVIGAVPVMRPRVARVESDRSPIK